MEVRLPPLKIMDKKHFPRAPSSGGDQRQWDNYRAAFLITAAGLTIALLLFGPSITVHCRTPGDKAAKAFIAALCVHRKVLGHDAEVDVERGLELLRCARPYQSNEQFQTLVDALPKGVLKGFTSGAANRHRIGVAAGCLQSAAEAHRAASDEFHAMLSVVEPRRSAQLLKGRDRCADYRKRYLLLCDRYRSTCQISIPYQKT